MTVHTPKWLLIALCIGAACVGLYVSWAQEFIAIDRCLDDGGRYEALWQTCSKTGAENPRTNFTIYTGPVYSGVLDGQKIQLQIRDDAQTYRMVKDGLRIEGEMNTEKGFEHQGNAVVYVLNPWAEDPMQIRLLLSKTGSGQELVLIGPNHRLQKDVTLRAEATELR